MFRFPREKITWDDAKAASNLRKHGVGFEEAVEVFRDESALYSYDEAHSEREDRYRVIGTGERLRVLLVVFAVREADRIRLISARKATKGEQRRYEEGH